VPNSDETEPFEGHRRRSAPDRDHDAFKDIVNGAAIETLGAWWENRRQPAA
jgi:hypothetical protein